MISLLLLTSFLHFQFAKDLPITSLGFDAGELRQSFNQSADQTRVIIVFSPT